MQVGYNKVSENAVFSAWEGKMNLQSEYPKLNILPFGTIYISVTIPPEPLPESEKKQLQFTPIQQSTAQTVIFSVPHSSSLF